MFTTDKVPASPQRGGPSYHGIAPGSDDRLSASKVSVVGQRYDTVLVAKLRFRLDVSEPTDGLVHCARFFLSFFLLFPSMFQHIHSRHDLWTRHWIE
jgi:hypothetical protein